METNEVTSRKVIVYIASSLDGFIAKPNDDLGFLSIVEQEGEDYGYAAFMKTIGTVIEGRRTYDWLMNVVPTYPHADKEAYIITRTHRPSIGQTHFYTGPIDHLIERLKRVTIGNDQEARHIYVEGGSQILNLMLNQGLIDEIIVSIIPILVGDGIKLFEVGIPEQRLQLLSSKSFESGLVQLHYKIIRGDHVHE